MIPIIHGYTVMFLDMINISRTHQRIYVNPSFWATSTAPYYGSTREGETGLSGAAGPIFRLLDHFFGRDNFKGMLGKQLLHKFLSPNHMEFVE